MKNKPLTRFEKGNNVLFFVKNELYILTWTEELMPRRLFNNKELEELEYHL